MPDDLQLVSSPFYDSIWSYFRLQVLVGREFQIKKISVFG